jgi:dolichol-phosphate mannosyltransferase
MYRHNKNSKARSERVIKEQEKHRSIPFLSKTARFFTVGASGLALNYIVSFLLSNVISNVIYSGCWNWYSNVGSYKFCIKQGMDI